MLLENEEEGRYDAILAADAGMCTLTNEQVLTAFRQFHRLLKKGGVGDWDK